MGYSEPIGLFRSRSRNAAGSFAKRNRDLVGGSWGILPSMIQEKPWDQKIFPKGYQERAWTTELSEPFLLMLRRY